jgi:two-component system LytT family sensor kinase
MLLQPFVENALLHGLLPKTNNRILSIRIERKSDKLCISVEDNGVGRHASSLKESSGNGKGLQLSEERLKLLAEKYKTDFQLKIEDLSNMDGLPLGTKVNLCFEEE